MAVKKPILEIKGKKKGFSKKLVAVKILYL